MVNRSRYLPRRSLELTHFVSCESSFRRLIRFLRQSRPVPFPSKSSYATERYLLLPSTVCTSTICIGTLPSSTLSRSSNRFRKLRSRSRSDYRASSLRLPSLPSSFRSCPSTLHRPSLRPISPERISRRKKRSFLRPNTASTLQLPTSSTISTCSFNLIRLKLSTNSDRTNSSSVSKPFFLSTSLKRRFTSLFRTNQRSQSIYFRRQFEYVSFRVFSQSSSLLFAMRSDLLTLFAISCSLRMR